MLSAPAPTNGAPLLSAGTRLLGEVISWTCPGVAVRHVDMVDALNSAGLDERVARQLLPRHAFARACKKLAHDRIIRSVGEDADVITFQFTAESRAGDRFEYTLETMLRLEKASGRVRCDLPALAAHAQDLLDRAIDHRTGSDVTRLIQRLFDRHADLFPVREAGGVYFVPHVHAGFVDRVQQFLGRVNGRMVRFPVPAGTPHGDRSVKDAVADGLTTLVADLNAAIDAFDPDTRADVVARAAERVRKARHKVASYAALLADQKDWLDRELAAAQRSLIARVSPPAPSPTP